MTRKNPRERITFKEIFRHPLIHLERKSDPNIKKKHSESPLIIEEVDPDKISFKRTHNENQYIITFADTDKYGVNKSNQIQNLNVPPI